MNCYNVRPHLEKMAAGEIDGVLFKRLEEHLQTCPGCRGEYQEMKLVWELWRQAPRGEPAPYFSPAWRQRIRQKAFEKEASGRGFFSVFKTNTLIPALGVLAVMLVLGALSFFNNRFAPKATIVPLITRYSPAQSSTIGIPLTAQFTAAKIRKNIAYHWITEYGRFLSWDGKVTELGREVRTEADKVYWSVDFNAQREAPDFNIRLQVEDLKTGRILARAELELEKNEEGLYVVKSD